MTILSVPDGVKKILEIIKKHPDIEYINANIAHFSTDLLNKYPKPVSSEDLPYDLPLDNKDSNEYYVERWDNLIKPEISAVFLGAIQFQLSEGLSGGNFRFFEDWRTLFFIGINVSAYNYLCTRSCWKKSILYW